MKNFGDVFQLSQGSEPPLGVARLAADFMYKSREGFLPGHGRWGGPPQFE